MSRNKTSAAAKIMASFSLAAIVAMSTGATTFAASTDVAQKTTSVTKNNLPTNEDKQIKKVPFEKVEGSGRENNNENEE